MKQRQIFSCAALCLIAIASIAVSLTLIPGIPGVLGAALSVVVLAIMTIDATHFVVPNELTATALVLGLIHAIIITESAPWALAVVTLRGAIVALAFLGIRTVYYRLRGREGLGLGDVKLAGIAGIWLDWMTVPIAIEVAALGAIAVYVSRQFLRSRPLRLQSRLPFGAFLAPSIWLGWLFESSLSGLQL